MIHRVTNDDQWPTSDFASTAPLGRFVFVCNQISCRLYMCHFLAWSHADNDGNIVISNASALWQNDVYILYYADFVTFVRLCVWHILIKELLIYLPICARANEECLFLYTLTPHHPTSYSRPSLPVRPVCPFYFPLPPFTTIFLICTVSGVCSTVFANMQSFLMAYRQVDCYTDDWWSAASASVLQSIVCTASCCWIESMQCHLEYINVIAICLLPIRKSRCAGQRPGMTTAKHTTEWWVSWCLASKMSLTVHRSDLAMHLFFAASQLLPTIQHCNIVW